MIGFKINNKWLDVDDDILLTLNLFNPIFDKEGLQRVFSYSLKFPTSPHNNNLFQHNYRIDAKGKRYYEMTLYLNHIPLEEGLFILQKTTAKSYNGVLSNNAIFFAKKYKEIGLRDLDMTENIPISTIVSNQFKTVNALSAKRCSIEINNILFVSETNNMATIVDRINEVYPGTAVLISDVTNGDNVQTLTISITWQDALSPLWINCDPSDPNRYSNFVVIAPEFRAASMVNTAWQSHLTNIKNTPESHCFPVVKNPDLYDGKNSTWSGYINYTTPTVGNVPIGALSPGGQWAHTLVPYVFVKKILEVVAANDSYTCNGDFYQLSELMDELIVHSNITLDNEVTEILDFTGGSSGNGVYNLMKIQYNLADHLPDITVFDFLQYLRSNFFLWFNVEKGQLFLNMIKSVLKGSIEDWTEKIDPNFNRSISEELGLDFDYRYDRTNDSNANDYELTPVSLSGNNLVAPLKWSAQFFSLYTKLERDEQQVDSNERDWIVPEVYEKGTSPDMDLQTNLEPRLLLYKGLQEDSEGNEYPFATSQDVDFGLNDLGEYTLNISGDKGLHEKFGKEYLRLLTHGDSISLPVKLTISDILNIKKWTSPRKRIYHPDGSFVGVIKSVKVKANVTGITSCIVEFITE